MQPLIDCCGHHPVGINVLAQGEGVLAGPHGAHDLVEILGGLIMLPYAYVRPHCAQDSETAQGGGQYGPRGYGSLFGPFCGCSGT